MSEYKVGDKVLVEARVVSEEKSIDEYRIKINSYTDDSWVKKDKIYPLTAKDTNIPVKTYEDGLNDAWKLAGMMVIHEKDGGFGKDKIEKIFGHRYVDYIFGDLTGVEAAAKIGKWEAQQNIQVQDQVRYGDTNHLGVVMNVIRQDEDIEYYVWWGSGSSSYERANDLTKTGRTIDITGLLAQIGGAE